MPRTGTNPTALLSTALAALLGGVVLRRFRPRRSIR
ncbi:MAG: LPXTG cell wall anchor domain-containing protein [Actinobacteria bacterium]|nr:LPXTG cell wall anchor domain-containing protein [Actinomycetota bacterium]